MRNFANLCIMVWIHMDAHEYVFVFQNLNILCIFSCRFLMTKISKLKFCQTLSNLEITVFINFINAKTHIQKFP
jgi:hypothetical protein